MMVINRYQEFLNAPLHNFSCKNQGLFDSKGDPFRDWLCSLLETRYKNICDYYEEDEQQIVKEQYRAAVEILKGLEVAEIYYWKGFITKKLSFSKLKEEYPNFKLNREIRVYGWATDSEIIYTNIPSLEM